ncbi:hypothetical protein PVAP13_6KG245006 [Panicum virgatum]|uniref:Uncharacterized protein n=1 Tax=Panicum virgatum TaxID=38727 RepID=A0A8T0RE22_PANVG|nr:hypothetical protein PVAP13_6KG245006 [Panicum virgatum]
MATISFITNPPAPAICFNSAPAHKFLEQPRVPALPSPWRSSPTTRVLRPGRRRVAALRLPRCGDPQGLDPRPGLPREDVPPRPALLQHLARPGRPQVAPAPRDPPRVPPVPRPRARRRAGSRGARPDGQGVPPRAALDRRRLLPRGARRGRGRGWRHLGGRGCRCRRRRRRARLWARPRGGASVGPEASSSRSCSSFPAFCRASTACPSWSSTTWLLQRIAGMRRRRSGVW